MTTVTATIVRMAAAVKIVLTDVDAGRRAEPRDVGAIVHDDGRVERVGQLDDGRDVGQKRPATCPFARIWSSLAPPSRQACAKSTSVQPDRAHSVRVADRVERRLEQHAVVSRWLVGRSVCRTTIVAHGPIGRRPATGSHGFGEAAAGLSGLARKRSMNDVLTLSGDEFRIVQDAQVHRNRRLDALDDGHLEHPAHARDGFGAGRGRAR